jgi:serine/threonine protein kinase
VFVGATIARYRVLEKLGAGGMGEVYRAHDDALDRDVAVKLLLPEGDSDAASVERFIREARAASALNHPHIVTIFEAGQVDGTHFIVMELVRGRTFRALIGQPAGVDILRDLGSQVAKALAAAPAAGIVHRDMKPENIMVRDDGYVKVLDFGVARLMPLGSEDSTLHGVADTVSRRSSARSVTCRPSRLRTAWWTPQPTSSRSASSCTSWPPDCILSRPTPPTACWTRSFRRPRHRRAG